jgi:RNA polymerase sigma-70 factor (ECF subfamily)
MKTLRFKRIVHQHKNLVYNQAYYFTSNKEDAEDITQEVFLKLWHHLDAVKGKAVKSWLMKVTRNVCIDHSRKRREHSLSEFEPPEQHQFMNRSDDSQDDPEQLLISEDLLQQGFKQLPETFRHIIIMREIQDLPYSLIAETMELPLNTVKVYLHRGRKLLAQYLNEHSTEQILTE